MKSVTSTLDERETQYGSYVDLADLLEAIIDVYGSSRNYRNLEPYQKTALYMDAMKTVRILNGDSNNSDSWHDKSGYSELVVKELKRREEYDK